MVFESDSVKLYKQYRAEGRDMINKIMAPCLKGLNMPKAARRMGLPVVGKTIVVEDETDMYALTDFCLHEKLDGLQSLLDRADPTTLELSPMQMEFFQAHRQARSSLYEALTVNKANSAVKMRDLLFPGQPEVLLTDIGFSDSPWQNKVQVLIFIRLLRIKDLNVTSGFFFAFNPALKTRLLKIYQREIKFVPEPEVDWQRFAIFYRLHRKWSLAQTNQAEMQYRDV